MLLMGDELSRTQKGNNNAFCQDNETSWLDWNSAASDPDLAPFTAALLHLRRRHEAFRRRSFLHGEPKPTTLRTRLPSPRLPILRIR